MKLRKSSLYAYLLIISIFMLGLLTSCTTHKTNKCSAYGNVNAKPNKQSAMKCPGW